MLKIEADKLSGCNYIGVVVSPIPVHCENGCLVTLDLWARDINAQADLMSIFLFCPAGLLEKTSFAPLNKKINVIHNDDISALEMAISSADFIQLPGNSGWRGSRPARIAISIAMRYKKPVFLGISSNRAKTVLLNNQKRGWFRRMVAVLNYLDIRFTQNWLAALSDGVFVVGSGLVKLIAYSNKNVHVSIASWIDEQDITRRDQQEEASRLRILMAGRFERMKGFHIGLAAIENISKSLNPLVTMIGQGPEFGGLFAQAKQCGFEVRFLDPVPYPVEFFSIMDQNDLVLMTNLNDEQPRLVFDALCRGVLPICPDSDAFKNLGLDPRCIYRQGDADDLANTISNLASFSLRVELLESSRSVLYKHTLRSMHQKRLSWMALTISSKC